MKIVQINAYSNGSTGKIMLSVHKELLKKGYESFVIWSIGRKANNIDEFKIEDRIGEFYHKIYSRVFGKQGFASWKNTKNIIIKLETIKPDIIHLHNLHNNNINIEMLFKYIKKNRIKVYWTFHDCWAFTGKCVHFEMAKCYKWKKECYNCPMLSDRPIAYIDKSRWLFNKKKELLSKIDLTIITPSEWLANYVKESFLGKNKIVVINNGINLNIFKHSESNIRKKYNLENKKVILGVASTWSKRKGLEDFIKLSKVLDNSYAIFLVGLSNKQIKKLPKEIIAITRTENQQELAEIYSEADIMLNTTYEDTYPTVNLESIACGTPVLTYDTGGSPEFIKYIENNDKIEYVIKKELVNKNIEVLKDYIDVIINAKKNFKVKNINNLSENVMVEKYIQTYNDKDS